MTADAQRAILALRLIAAKAAMLADDLRDGRLYPGDLTAGHNEIERALKEVRLANDR